MGSRHYMVDHPTFGLAEHAELMRQEAAYTDPIHLWWHGRWTVAHRKLRDGLTESGAQVKRRGRGFTDFRVIESLLTRGYLEIRREGPRGGKRYFTTDAGRRLLETKAESC